MSPTGELEKVHAEMEALFQQHPHLRTTYKEHHQQHMKNLTRYNAIKDIGQKILGLCAEKAGGTVKEQYEKYEIDLDD